MSDAPSIPATAPQAAPALPLFFTGVVALNASQHGHLRLDRDAGYAFAAQAQAIPLGLGELEIASQYYPIVFTTGDRPVPMALLSVQEGANAFLLPDGNWRPQAYIPAYVRAFPFVFVDDKARDTVIVGMDPSAKAISATAGSALFEDGKPSPALNEAIGFCSTYRDSVAASTTFGIALEQAGLLQEEEATINFTAGGSARIRGFKILKADRLANVPDETFLDWRRRGWIAPIYAHLHSSQRWSSLVELAVPPQE